MGKLKEKIKGMIEKVSGDTFHYHPGSISRLDPEPSPEERHQESIDRIKDGKCPRCGGDIEGREFCGGPCGGKVSVMLEAVKRFRK